LGKFNGTENLVEAEHIRHIIEYYQSIGFSTAIDDFGAGYAGLNRLIDLQPQWLKLDRAPCSARARSVTRS